MKKQFFKNLQLPKGSKILDLGCYNGEKNKWMRRKDYFYQGIDLLYTDKHIKKVDFVSWIKKNKKKYDLIISEFSLQQVPRKYLWKTIQHIKKSLKPGGYFFLTSFNEDDIFGPYFMQKEYLKISSGLKILFLNRKRSRDKWKRNRSITEILVRKQ